MQEHENQYNTIGNPNHQNGPNKGVQSVEMVVDVVFETARYKVFAGNQRLIDVVAVCKPTTPSPKTL